MNTLKRIRAILLLPVTVTIIIPLVIIHPTNSVSIGWGLSPPLNLAPLLPGILFIGFGLVLWTTTSVLFVRIGKGTLAAWDSTGKLVVRGVYRYVRNPMIDAVFCILLGEAVDLALRTIVSTTTA